MESCNRQKKTAYSLHQTHWKNRPILRVVNHNISNLYCCLSIQNDEGTHHLGILPTILNHIGCLHERHAFPGQVVDLRIFSRRDPRHYIWPTPKIQKSIHSIVNGFVVINSQGKLNEIIGAFPHPLDSLYFLLSQKEKGMGTSVRFPSSS